MKKFLAVLLAVLMMFSAMAVVASADEGLIDEQHETYEICEDPDFINLNYADLGNDVATILKPGDVLNTYKATGKRNTGVQILYYPDIDAVYKGKWVPADTNNIAFSISGEENFLDDSAKYDGVAATIQDIDYTDFTIAYSDENVFVGWVVTEFVAATNQVKVAAVWQKNHKVKTGDKQEDVFYIVNFFYSIRQAISSSVMNAVKWLSNAVLFVETWFYNLIFVKKA